jgi:hypothetical protein
MADCVAIFSPVVEWPKDVEAPDAFGVRWSYNPRAEGGTLRSGAEFAPDWRP